MMDRKVGEGRTVEHYEEKKEMSSRPREMKFSWGRREGEGGREGKRGQGN